MKKVLVGALIGVILGLSGPAVAQRSIIAGESSPGVYINIKVNPDGTLALGGGSVGLTFTTTTPTVTSSSTTILAANANRRFLIIQNNDAAGNIFINYTSAATTAHLKLVPGQSIFLDAAVTAQAITAIGSIASNANVVVVEGQ